MASPPFSIPFAHWDFQSPPTPISSSVTVSRFLSKWLVVGLFSGEILVFDAPPTTTLEKDLTLRARLSGHKSSIVFLELFTTRSETSADEHLLLSLSTDGTLSKWSLSDGRCLQSVCSLSNEPRGLTIIKQSGIRGGWLTDSFVLVYGCSTEIVVLNAESLETAVLWTGNVDWPLPVGVGKKVDGAFEVVTMTPGGEFQSWSLAKDSSASSRTGKIGVHRDHEKRFQVEVNMEWGTVKQFLMVEKLTYLVVQGGGLSCYHFSSVKGGFQRLASIEIQDGIAEVQLSLEERLVYAWTNKATAKIFAIRKGRLDEVVDVSRPGFLVNGRVTSMAFTGGNRNRGLSAVFVQRRTEKGIPSCSTVMELGGFTVQGTEDINWFQKATTNVVDEFQDPPSTCSAIFSNMLVFAHSSTLRMYTLTSFLLSYHDPTKEIEIPISISSKIVLLKRLHVGEYIHVPGRGPSVIKGGKEYLIVGVSSGEIYIIESPTFHTPTRLPLSPSAAISAHLLPSNLGKRLRSTLLVSSVDGTASVVDVERKRVMVTFPSHNYSTLSSFSTKPGSNTVLLTYDDGTQREWDLGEENGGVLRSSSPRSGNGGSENAGVNLPLLPPVPSEEDGWIEITIGGADDETDDKEYCELEGSEENGDGTLVPCTKLSKAGIPTAAVNIRVVLEALAAATTTAKARTRESEKRVVGNHPALISAKALLTALIPGGIDSLFGNGWEESGGQDEGNEWGDEPEEEEEDWRSIVGSYFYRRKQPGTMGQIGAGRHISLVSPVIVAGDMDEDGGIWKICPTVTAILLMMALTVIGGILDATGKLEGFDSVAEQVLKRRVGKECAPALGVFAKFWMDENPLIQRTARRCLHVCMKTLSGEDRKRLLRYWPGFLPVSVPPELFSSKEVARSVIILGKLVADDEENIINLGVRKNVALSVELLLGDSIPLFQDTAIELVGYGWTKFQSLFDAFEVVHVLIRISSSDPTTYPETRRKTLNNCILEIAQKNSPLLVAGLANNISHGSSSPLPTAAANVTLTTAVTISSAALRLVTMVVREDAVLFRDVLSLIVEAIVKILDPNGGMREKVLPAVTELMDLMVEAYPTLAFHRPSQRLALSTAPGIIIVYDLKTATQEHILDGHHHLANFLSFSIDGRYLVALDLDEDVLYVWRFVTGFLSFMGASGGDGAGTLAPRAKMKFANARKVGVVDVEWTGEKTLRVTAGADVSNFTI